MKVLRVVVLAALLAPSTALAGTSSQAADNAATQCNVLRAHVGASAFDASYASFGACVSKLTPLARQNVAAATVACRAQPDGCVTRFVKVASTVELRRLPNVGNVTSAAKACRAQQADKSFAQTYGSNGNLANAFGKCVSSHASATATPTAPLSPTRTVPNPCTGSYPPAKFPIPDECMYRTTS